MKKMLRVMTASALLALAGCTEKDETRPDPTSVQITSVKIITLPLTDGGNPWDVDGGADVYVQVENGPNVLYQATSYYNDVEAQALPLVYTFRYTLPALDQTYSVSLMDYDVTSGDDYMAGVEFRPETFKKDRPARMTFSSADARVEIGFTWE